MSVTTSHHISRYYDYFRDKEIVFTKANLKSLRMDPRQIYLKCNGGQWPCIINSSSLQQAKVIIGTSSGAYSAISKNKNSPVSLRYCFFDNNNEPIQFFVTCGVLEIKSYQGSNELAIVTLTFSQRPPDDLILKIGEFIEVNQNFQNRKEERIGINKNSLRELGIPKEESYIFISGVPRKCILKDISFGGARIMLVGIPKFLENKAVDLRLFFSDTNEKIAIKGIVKNADFLPGRKDISIVHIEFDVEEIPMTYKFHINSYITSYQKQMIENQLSNQAAAQKVEAEAAAKVAQMQAQNQATNQAAAQAQIQGGVQTGESDAQAPVQKDAAAGPVGTDNSSATSTPEENK
ncbi:MAG: PilZ domain-containing protein [Treponema sp.]|nr:PilZ domain-containing protein [Treponema sp.]